MPQYKNLMWGYEFTNGDKQLFLEIAADIKNHPDDYREAGKWLDEYCTKETFRTRLEESLNIIKEAGAPFEAEAEIISFMLDNNAYQNLDMFRKMNIGRENTPSNRKKMAPA